VKTLSSSTTILISVLLLMSSGSLWAQGEGAVVNGDFETGACAPPWILTGGNQYTQVVEWEITPGDLSYCLKRRPGAPEDGGIEQTIYLMEGIPYVFSADVAALWSGC
jgi:hypothetical protein